MKTTSELRPLVEEFLNETFYKAEFELCPDGNSFHFSIRKPFYAYAQKLIASNDRQKMADMTQIVHMLIAAGEQLEEIFSSAISDMTASDLLEGRRGPPVAEA